LVKWRAWRTPSSAQRCTRLRIDPSRGIRSGERLSLIKRSSCTKRGKCTTRTAPRGKLEHVDSARSGLPWRSMATGKVPARDRATRRISETVEKEKQTKRSSNRRRGPRAHCRPRATRPWYRRTRCTPGSSIVRSLLALSLLFFFLLSVLFLYHLQYPSRRGGREKGRTKKKKKSGRSRQSKKRKRGVSSTTTAALTTPTMGRFSR
jgi:hypothetical protein